jgi:predicted kinase
MGKLIIFAGHAGTGKTTVAKKAMPKLIEKCQHPFIFLDKDTAYGAFSSHLLGVLTGNEEDRDSPVYLDNFRDWEYSGLVDIARENLELGVDVILVGPFSKEIQSLHMFDTVFLRLPSETEIKVVWVDLDVLEAKKRIEKRADPRDKWKIEHWDEYKRRRIEPPKHPQLYRFDNTEFDQAKFDAMIDLLATPCHAGPC